MSREALAKVVQRAISDASFRRQLSSDTAGALRGFDLTPDEVSALRAGDAGRLSTLGIDQRMSKSFALGGGALAATKMAQSDLGTSNPSMIDDVSGAGSRTVIPSDPNATLTADDAGGASTRASSVRTGDDWKFADKASGGGMENYPAHSGLAGPSQLESARAGGAGSDAARLARLDETFNGGSPAVDASAAGSNAAARLARLDETFNGGSPAVDASGGSAPTTAFIDESEAYLTKVGYDANAATSAVTDAHDRGDGAGISAVTDAHDRGDVTRIDDDAADSGSTSAGSDSGPHISS